LKNFWIFSLRDIFLVLSTPEKPGIYGKMTARATRMARKTCFHDQMTIRFLRF
jgi:hypothetical protein